MLSNEFLLNPIVAALLNLGGEFGTCRLHDAPFVEHVDDVGANHLEQSVVVGDDDAAALGGAQLVHTLGHDAHGVDVQTRVGLVEDGERGFQHGHLEDLVAFLLAPTETFVHRAARELRVELHYLTFLVHQLLELHTFQLGQPLILALLVDSGLQEIHIRNKTPKSRRQ